MFRIFFILFLMASSNLYASAPTRPNNYVANTVIDPVAVNTNENTLYTYLQTGVDTFADGSIVGDDIANSASIPYSKLSLAGSIVRADLSSSSFVTLPTGAVFFMITGACPTGTTDVSATYSNKYIKVNATPGTSSGVVLTGTTDSHVLTTPEMPAHTHSIATFENSLAGSGNVMSSNASGSVGSETTSSTGGGGGHTHTISSATTLEPSSVTARLCQVN